MAFSLEKSSVSKKLKRQIVRELTVWEEKTEYNIKPSSHSAFYETETDIYLPIGQWENYLGKFPYPPSDYERTKAKFTATLYTKESDPKERGRDQDVVVSTAMKRLKKFHSVLISAFTGFGKTLTAVCLLAKLKYKTAILCHLDKVKEQWPDEIEKFTGGTCKVQMVKGSKPLDPDADVYIFGIFKAAKFSPEELESIGLVIVDEIHLCTTKAFTNSLLKFTPRYLVGLSATPDRKDGMDKLFDFYFGDPRNYIFRKEVKNFTVIKYQTLYKPTIKYVTRFGKTIPDWCTAINSIEYNEERQKEIAQIAIDNPKEKIIILCNRINQTNGIYDILDDAKESVAKLVGTKKKYDKSARILVAGLKKGGVGLNDPDLTMLILASDVTDVRQNEGRIRTTDNIVYDIVDYYKPFENHWEMRETWYESRGATIIHQGPEVSYARGRRKTTKTQTTSWFLPTNPEK